MQEILVSELTPDPTRMSPWLAALWQGPPTPGITLLGWYYLGTEPRSMLVVWQAADADARAGFEEVFSLGGSLVTRTARDATPGLAAALARDLDGFAAWMRSEGNPEEAIARGIDLRRRGLEAPTREAALAAGEAHARESA